MRRGEAPRHKRGGLFFTHEKRRTRKFEKFRLTATVRFTTSRDTRASRGAASRGVIARERRRARAACLHGRVFPGFHGARGPQGALVAELLSLGSLALVLRGGKRKRRARRRRSRHDAEASDPGEVEGGDTASWVATAYRRASVLATLRGGARVPLLRARGQETSRRLAKSARRASLRGRPRLLARPGVHRHRLRLDPHARGAPDARVRRLRRPHAPGSPRGAVALDRRRGLGRRCLFPRKPARELPHGRLVLEPDARPRRRGARPVEHRARVRQVGRVRVRCHGAAAARRAVRLVDMARARRRRNRGRGSARLAADPTVPAVPPGEAGARIRRRDRRRRRGAARARDALPPPRDLARADGVRVRVRDQHLRVRVRVRGARQRVRELLGPRRPRARRARERGRRGRRRRRGSRGRVRVRAVLGGGDGEHGGLRRRCRDEPRRAHRGRRGHDRGQHVVRVACRARRRAGGEARRRVAAARGVPREDGRAAVFSAQTPERPARLAAASRRVLLRHVGVAKERARHERPRAARGASRSAALGNRVPRARGGDARRLCRRRRRAARLRARAPRCRGRARAEARPAERETRRARRVHARARGRG